MEFLLPEGTPKSADSTVDLPFDRVRLAWYYRPSDVSDRPVADSRVLLAAIYSEVCDINQLRAKCHVIHRDKISDLAGWKRRPDHFYFNRLFDPYIKKEFEVIPSTYVSNRKSSFSCKVSYGNSSHAHFISPIVPANIRDVLVERYEYIVAEKEVVQDLTDVMRLCDSCEDWCAHTDAVQCDRCKKHFHMHCVQPPLTAKPARGYGWTCGPCSRRHEEEVDNRTRNAKPKSNANRARGRPRKQNGGAMKEEDMHIKHFKMWPFRYFGQHTVAEDTLDPDDLIFPRTASRVGPRFQANVSVAPGVDEPPPPEPVNRGGEDTIELLSNVNAMEPETVVDLYRNLDALTKEARVRQSVDWLTEMIRRYSSAFAMGEPFDRVPMARTTRTPRWKLKASSFFDKEWSQSEVAAFEDALSMYGAELRSVKAEVGSRTIFEVVRFYGQWKSRKVGEENARIRANGKPTADKRARPKLKSVSTNGNTKGDEEQQQEVGLSDDEGSVVGPVIKPSPSCGACQTRQSVAWWKGPKGLTSELLCDPCGAMWRKYADLNVRPLRDETAAAKAKVADKREGTPLQNPVVKKAKLAKYASPPLTSAPQLRCVGCLKNGPKGKVLECSECYFRVHAGSCGVVIKPYQIDSWICELCQNEKTLEASLVSDCLLCPPPSKAVKAREKKCFPPAESFLRACKPTEGQGWTHLLCSVFMPELQYTDTESLRMVEGINVVAQNRWSSPCVLCGLSGGAVVKCSDCIREYHVSCAWKTGHRFGFEIQPIKSSRRDTVTIARFGEQTGLMNPVIHCKEHGTRRDLFDICAIDDDTGETALQTYCKLYKQAPVQQAHGLLRKARRLDLILNARSDASFNSLSDDPPRAPQPEECFRCHTEFSPLFYLEPGPLGSVTLCHRCHYEVKHPVISSTLLNSITV